MLLLAVPEVAAGGLSLAGEGPCERGVSAEEKVGSQDRPRGSDAEPPREGAGSDRNGGGAAGGPSSAGRVLVVDDNEDCRVALRALLEARGYAVFEASDGAGAVREALRAHPDLILMDLMMPGMDGVEATRRIRAELGRDGLCIVAVSAMEGAEEAARAAGFDDCVLKPIDVGDFPDLVAGWLASG